VHDIPSEADAETADVAEAAVAPNDARRWIRRLLLLAAFALLLLLGGCAGDDDADVAETVPSSTSTTAAAPAAERWEPSCPDGVELTEGLNTGFPSDGEARQVHVAPPADVATPRPVFVALTGTVQPEPDFLRQSAIDTLVDDGWIVIAPVRTCSAEGTNCNGRGMQNDGRVWEPWFDGHPDPSIEGPDAAFFERAVKCVADTWPVDQDRVYVGGISAGGSMTNRALTYNSDFYAGGVVASGNWYDGWCCPRPLRRMDSAIVVVLWGGPNDRWPLTGQPLAVYAPETKAEAEYYATQEEVVTLACTGSHGHIWPPAMTAWLAETIASHPKGSDPDDFVMPAPPEGFSCVRGPYTDH
jgi:dienelactone hydrolase